MTDLDQMLVETSRTFALAIPLLPEPTRRQVTVAYLLFRVADTFEDAGEWSRERRLGALADFGDMVRTLDPLRAQALSQQWTAARPTGHEGYLRLLAAFPEVLAELAKTAQRERRLLAEHTLRTAEGMASFVASGGEDGTLRLGSVDELKRYCYVVAGIVGELLTELFIASGVGPDEV